VHLPYRRPDQDALRKAQEEAAQRMFSRDLPTFQLPQGHPLPSPPQRKIWRGRYQQMAATAHPLATKAALSMLRKGGNALDAAIAAAFVLAVVEPYGSGLGGGGFLLYYDAKKRQVRALDFRERAPRKADALMYKRYGDEEGKKRSQEGHLAAAIPGFVAGLEEAAKTWASLPWWDLLQPAHHHAKRGFRLHRLFAGALRYKRKKMRAFPETKRVFFPRGRLPRKGDLFKQPDLAWTLQRLQRYGAADFYRGRIGGYLMHEMAAGEGIWVGEDLESYKPYWVEPVRGAYRGFTIYSMPSPSSGGVHLIQMLNLLSGFPLHQMKPRDPMRLHLVAEAMRLAFADRARYQGDARFLHVPNHGLLSPAYADQLRKKISLERALPQDGVLAGDPYPFNHKHTSHISILDQWGNAASMTLTINTSFGAGVIAKGTGILLNNEMDDFTTLPGQANAYQLLQGEKNLIAPQKTPLSSMTPTLVFDEKNQLRGALGSPGGPTIITTVLQLLLKLIDQGVSVEQAMRFPRLHHQWQPPKLYFERAFRDPPLRKRLQAMGHNIRLSKRWGNAMAIWINEKGHLTGAADPRGDGKAAGY
jgi:gamma-glutamyltranspeptidase/glutathione hydrolase